MSIEPIVSLVKRGDICGLFFFAWHCDASPLPKREAEPENHRAFLSLNSSSFCVLNFADKQ